MQNLEPHKLTEASPLFRDLQPDEIATITAHLRSTSFVRGSRIMQRGVWHGLFYIIAFGKVSVLLQEEAEHAQATSYTPDPHALVVARLGPGDCFGEMSLITGDPPSATVRTEEDTQLWSLSHVDFLTLLGSCPTLLRNINTILSLRLAHTNQQLLLHATAERVELSLLDDTASSIQHSLVVHVAFSLAARCHKRVLLLECCDQQEAVGPRFMQYPGQLRPSLAACMRDHSLLQAHHAPTTSTDGAHFPALSVLTDSGTRESLGADAAETLSCLPDIARFYDYILLVTTPATPHDLALAVSRVCTRFLALIPASRASAQTLASLPTPPSAVFVTDVPEGATIGQQDIYASQLNTKVTRLLPAHRSLLKQCWEQQASLREIAHDAALTKAVDFLARHIAHQTVGIAFGGGGARGFAHLGTLEGLLAHDVPIDYISACSSGIITPGMYLIGKSFAESEEIFLQIQHHIVQWHLPRTSLFSNKGLKHMLLSLCGEMRFEDLATPFAMVAVDLSSRAGVVLDRGPIWQAALASVALPGIFPPVMVGEHILMDAGMHDPVPLRLVHNMGADILLASELGGQEPPSLESATPWLTGNKPSSTNARSPHMLDLLLRSYDLTMATIGMHSIREAHVVIRPILHHVSLRQFSKGRQFIAAGREAVEHSLPSLRQFLPWVV